MKQKRHKQGGSKGHRSKDRSLGPVYSAIILLLVAICVIAVVADYLKRHPSTNASGASTNETQSPIAADPELGTSNLVAANLPVAQATNTTPALATTSAPPKVVSPPAPTPAPVPVPVPVPATSTPPTSQASSSTPAMDARLIVRNMIRFDQTDVPFTPEQAAAWKEHVHKLAQQGSRAIPAIREFLAKRLDHHFGPEDVAQLGYTSVRAAMFDALRQIGGLPAIAVFVQTLQTTADPLEVALLSQNLENMSPGSYREQILKATQETLEMAQEDKLPDRDVAPLFEILHTYGGPDVVPQLEQAVQNWKYYATAALGWLPEGAGIPSLVHMVQEPGGSQDAALQMLAQLATENEDAHETVLQLAGSNRIPPNLWPYLSSPLSGEEVLFQASVLHPVDKTTAASELNATHINFGNQNLYRGHSPATSTPEKLKQRITFIDELLKVTSDQTAVQTLNTARERVQQRLARLSPDSETQ